MSLFLYWSSLVLVHLDWQLLLPDGGDGKGGDRHVFRNRRLRLGEHVKWIRGFGFKQEHK
jgi:hypothetical protein